MDVQAWVKQVIRQEEIDKYLVKGKTLSMKKRSEQI